MKSHVAQHGLPRAVICIRHVNARACLCVCACVDSPLVFSARGRSYLEMLCLALLPTYSRQVFGAVESCSSASIQICMPWVAGGSHAVRTTTPFESKTGCPT